MMTTDDRDELLLESLMDLVPNSTALVHIIELLRNLDRTAQLTTGCEPIPESIYATLTGYGTLLNVIQSATEAEGSMTDRLYAGYYELTNNEG